MKAKQQQIEHLKEHVQKRSKQTHAPISTGSDIEDEDEKDDPSAQPLDAVLRDYRYNLEVTLMASNRSLKVGTLTKSVFLAVSIFLQPWEVKPISIVFESSTCYGSRQGHHPALLVISKDKGNVYLRSALWKSGVVHNVSMLPRLLGLLIWIGAVIRFVVI